MGLEGLLINRIERFKYLGSILQKNRGGIMEDIASRISGEKRQKYYWMDCNDIRIGAFDVK